MRRAGQPVSLTPTEYRLLRYFMLNPAARAVEAADTLEHVWDYDFGGDGNVVETFIELPAQEGRLRGTGAAAHRAAARRYVLRLPDR